MSDIYDYTYSQSVKRQKEEHIYSNITFSEETNSGPAVNTADFSARDLQMFVDSLETIARLEQDKLERRQKRKVKKQPEQPKKRQVTCLDGSLCSSIHDDYIYSLSDESRISENIYDEVYIGPVQAQSTALYSNLIVDTNTTSDSGDSGISVNNNSSLSPIYETLKPLRPRSRIVSYSQSKSFKYRLLALITKKQLPLVEILSSTTVGEQNEETVVYDMDDSTHQQFTKRPKQKSSWSKPKRKLLQKAKRLLTL